MDNASFLASLTPDLRQEILLTGDDAFISSLPATLIAEANVLRERVASQHRRRAEETNNASNASGLGATGARPAGAAEARPAQPPEGQASASRGRRQRNGKLVRDFSEILPVRIPPRPHSIFLLMLLTVDVLFVPHASVSSQIGKKLCIPLTGLKIWGLC